MGPRLPSMGPRLPTIKIDKNRVKRSALSTLVFRQRVGVQYIGSCLKKLARITAEQGRPTSASRLYRLAVSLHKSVAPSFSPIGERKPSATGFAALLTEATSASEGKHSTPYKAELTEREVEVLRLVAQGLTDN